jgi:hypothetical protein
MNKPMFKKCWDDFKKVQPDNTFVKVERSVAEVFWQARDSYIAQLESGLRKLIQINRNEAMDRYGNPELAEEWSCVIVARAALQED